MGERPGGLRVGLDVGGSKVLGVLLDGPDARPVVRHSLRLPTDHGTEGVVGTAAEVVRGLCAAEGVDPADLTGVGLALPGIVDPRTGTVSHAVNLRIDLADVPVAALLAERLDPAGRVPVTVENDLNAAALGAAAVTGHADMALLALGTGLAAGLVLDGRLRRGHAGAAGEIGHLTYRPDGPPCACGQRGCLELYASGSALDASWPAPDDGRPVPAALFAAAAAGDPGAVAVRDAYADAVAAAVRVLVLGVDVARVVLGGGVAHVGAPLLRAVRDAVGRQGAASAFVASLGLAERIELAPADVPVGAVGAALATSPRPVTVPMPPVAPAVDGPVDRTPRPATGAPAGAPPASAERMD